jgi:methylase of polypeptide subunit release factors
VADRLGPAATAALRRHETVPARRRTSARDPLGALVRLFLLQDPMDARTAGLPAEALLAAGLVEQSAGELRAVLDVRPYGEAVVGHSGEAVVGHSGEAVVGYSGEAVKGHGGEPEGPAWWVVSDLGTGLDGRHRSLDPQHVLGVGGASTTLARATVRGAVERTLDIGTGCGVQALHASRHSRAVVATDVSARALRLAAMTAELSDVRLDLRQGDLLDPVEGETFDLVVCNPPFVVGAPAGDARHTYRDAGHDLDGVGARLAASAPALLREGGTFQMLANWVYVADGSWEERVAGWLPAHGVDALVVQREVLDPAEYVATWLRDAGEEVSPAYRDHYEAWLAALEDAGVQGLGFGILSVRRTDEERRVTTLDWPHPVQQPLGPHLDAWFARQRWLAAHHDDEALLGAVLVLAADAVQEQVGAPGAEDPAHLVLRQQVGLRRAVEADTATAALAGACDGQLPVGTLVAAVREVLGEVPDGLLDEVRQLVEVGVLDPPV